MTASRSSEMGYLDLSGALWTSVLELLSDGISVHSESGEIIWANQALCRLYSKSLSELTGLSGSEAFDQQTSDTVDHSRLNTGGQVGEVSLNGKIWSVATFCFSDEVPNAGFVRVMHDVTEERQARAHLIDAERFASLGQMLFGLAHNVGTPLNIISGYAEFLLMRLSPDERGFKELSAIMDQTKRIAAMLNEALDLARPGKIQVSAIDMKALLSESLDLGAHYFRRSNVHTQLTCAIIPQLIYGEAPRLRQAFFSLLLNAAQKVAGGRIEVAIAEGSEGRYGLTVRIIGTEASGQDHDFARSLASLITDVSTETPGLGLLLAREILNDAGAAMTFEEYGERGVALLLQLPVSAGR